MPFSPGSLRSQRKARATAREFAKLVGRVVNTTISRAPISFVEVEGRDFDGYIAHCGTQKVPVPMPLENGKHLFLYQRLGLRRSERYLTTLEYRYAYQANASDDSWIFRYEYQREPGPGYPYPRCHVHVNACPTGYDGVRPFESLHLPTGDRVTIETLVRHLIAEHGLQPVSQDWEPVVSDAEASFGEIQRRRRG